MNLKIKKIFLVILTLSVFVLNGCQVKIIYPDNSNKTEQIEVETYIVSGTIVQRNVSRSSVKFVVELEDGFKVPVWERIYSDFSNGIKVGDKVSFKVQESEYGGYEIIGINLEDILEEE